MRIEKKGWALVYKATGERVVHNELIRDFRGEAWIVTGGNPPQHSASTGKVWATKLESDWNRELYPQVFELQWLNTMEGV